MTKPTESHDQIVTNKVANPSILTFNATADIDAIRHEDFNGVDHLVVPIVALVEGVLHPSNASAPELALASEFGKAPLGWNGRPVVLGHPVVEGVQVSANSPAVLEDEAFGMLFNTVLDDKKLKTEAWINLTRVAELGDDVTAAVERLESDDEMTEVSTGLFMSLETKSGNLDGKEFDGIWRDVVPDHLALLPAGTIGACDVANGCGAPRLNTSGVCSCGGSGGCESCSGDSHSKDSSTSPPSNDEPQESLGMFNRLLQGLGNLFSFRSQGAESLSDVDTRKALESALTVQSPNSWFWVIAVFEGHFIYEGGLSDVLHSRTFSIDDSGVVSLGTDITDVRPVTEFVPIITQEIEEMSNQKRVEALIANEGTHFAADDSEWLLSLNEAQLDKLEPKAEVTANDSASDDSSEDVTEVNTATSGDTGDTGDTEVGVTANEQTPVTAEAYIQQAPEEIQEVLTSALSMQKSHKDGLVKTLLSTNRCKFSEKELSDMSTNALSNLCELADIEDHSIRQRHNAGEDNNVEEGRFIAAPKVFESEAS